MRYQRMYLTFCRIHWRPQYTAMNTLKKPCCACYWAALRSTCLTEPASEGK